MRIVVTSDVHRRQKSLLDIIERHLENADLFINLGDSEEDVDAALLLYPNLKIKRVAGNCDWSSALPICKTINAGGKKILFCHGHTVYVKHGYEMLEERAKSENVDICLFGHTHVPYLERKDGICYMNPGAVCDGVYGIIDIVGGEIMAYHAKID